MLKLLYFDLPHMKKKEKTEAVLIIDLWVNRDVRLTYHKLREKLIGEIMAQGFIIIETLKKKCTGLFCKKFLDINMYDLL